MGTWRKSSYSGGNTNDRVEANSATGLVRVRDTADRDGVTLAFSPEAWETFTASLG